MPQPVYTTIRDYLREAFAHPDKKINRSTLYENKAWINKFKWLRACTNVFVLNGLKCYLQIEFRLSWLHIRMRPALIETGTENELRTYLRIRTL